MNGKKTRASLFVLVAAYLIYLCYGLFQGRLDASTTMSSWVRYASIGVFVVSAVVLAVYAFCLWKQGKRKKKLCSSRQRKPGSRTK